MSRNPFAQSLGERCLAHASPAAPNSGDAPLALEQAHAQVRRALSPVIGDAGFAALFARGLRKSFSAHPGLERAMAEQPIGEVGPPSAWLRSLDPAVAHTISVTVMTYMVELLSTLIGTELTKRFMDDALPATDMPEVTATPRRHDDE
jgi:hypothetical protein